MTTFIPDDEYVLTFGKHKGKMLKDVPDDYLYWMHDQKWMTNGVIRRYLDDNIDAIIANLNKNKYFNKISKDD